MALIMVEGIDHIKPGFDPVCVPQRVEDTPF